MVSLLAAGALASKELFSYNRKNFMFDRKLKQVRDFQEQDMRMEQFALYREDVRDLVELTVGKMDLYLVSSALLIDRTCVMICKQNLSLPRWSPDWAVTLNSLALCSGVFYMLLALWLAMYASISAQSFGTRLLTQFVRLPYVTEEELAAATAAGEDYEQAGAASMLRVPVLQADNTTADGPAAASSSTIPASQAQGPQMVPPSPGGPSVCGGPAQPGGVPAGTDGDFSGMLEHIRLYRKVQLNWQAYDAYARVCLFIGASSLLYSCMYWCQGQFVQNVSAPVPALGTAMIFAVVQIMLCRLDLRLNRQDSLIIGCLLAIMPILTTLGMLLYKQMLELSSGEPPLLMRMSMCVCALSCHVLHVIVAFLTLMASQPNPNDDEDALLPNKFRSTLYLDVFGWLLNSSGPGSGTAVERRSATYVNEVDAFISLTREAVGGVSQFVRTSQRSMMNWVSTGRSERALREDQQELEERRSNDGGADAGLRSPSRRSSDLGPGDDADEVVMGIVDELELPPSPPRPSFREALERSANSQLPVFRNHELSAEIREEASRLWASPALRSPRRSPMMSPRIESSRSPRLGPEGEPAMVLPPGVQEQPSQTSDRWGGSEAVDYQTMERVTVPSRTNPANFTEMPPQRVSVKTKLPGETPWKAFLHGTTVIVILWVMSAVWTLFNLSYTSWRENHHRRQHERQAMLRLDAHDELDCAICSFLIHDSDGADGDGRRLSASDQDDGLKSSPTVSRRRLVEKGLLKSPKALASRIRTRGACTTRRAMQDVAISCRSETSSQCTAAFLQSGGRALVLCHAVRRGSDRDLLMLSKPEILRLPSGAPSLKKIAVGRPQGGPLKVFAKADDGALLVLSAGSRMAGASRRSLMPELELEQGVTKEAGALRSAPSAYCHPLHEEHLMFTGDALMAVQARQADSEAQDDRCPASVGETSMHIRRWELASGQRTSRSVRLRGHQARSVVHVMQAACPRKTSDVAPDLAGRPAFLQFGTLF